MSQQQEPKEYVKVKIERYKWEAIANHCHLDSTDFIITDIIIKDDLFNDDTTWHTLKKESTKAYKKWQEYEFRVRHNIKK